MPTIEALVRALSESLSVDAQHVAWLARKLRDANVVPGDDKDAVSSLHAARLLVAVLAAGRPIEAVAAVQAYESAPALHFIRTVGHREVDRWQAEDTPISPGNGPDIVSLSRGFISALAWFISFAATDPTTPLPAQIRVRRAINFPLGGLIEIPVFPSEPGKGITIAYGRAGNDGEALGGEGLEVYAAAPGAVLQAVADLLCPLVPTPAECSRSAPPANTPPAWSGA